MRLNVYIAKSGFASRRKADVLIETGKVKVNGSIVKEPFFNVNDECVEIEGQKLLPKKNIYIIFNKPRGVTTTLHDVFASKKIIDFFPTNMFPSISQNTKKINSGEGIYPVGRLDRDSKGLLLLTNNGSLCYQLTHPKFGIEKEYLVEVKGIFSNNDCKKAREGLDDDGDFLSVKAIHIEQRGNKSTHLNVVISCGKKRHLRRLFKRLGFEVAELKRIRIGGIILGDLREGTYQMIDEKKVFSLIFGKNIPKKVCD